MATTSGTVGTTTISCGQIFDHAFRRCRILAQLITSEHIDIARRLLWMILTKLNEKGIALWAIDTQLIGLNTGLSGIAMPVGGIANLNSNLRQITMIAGTVSTNGGGSPNSAYDQNLSTSCVNTIPNSYMDVRFTTPPQVLTQFGIDPATSGPWTFQIQVSSNSGATYTTVQTVSTTAVAGKWLWYDIDGQTAATNCRIQATGGTTLAVYELMCGNNPSDIPMSPMDRDTWTQLPNKQMTGRPVQYWWDRRINNPIMHIWPTPDASFVFTYLLVNWVQRQLQDVGTMAQSIEIPDRWFLPVIAELARQVGAECKEATQDPAVLAAEADRLTREAWDGESDGAPVRMLPNIGCYTA